MPAGRRLQLPRWLLVIAATLVTLLIAGCGSGGDAAGGGAATSTTDEVAAPDRPTIVVTYSVLGAVVSELVGDAAEVVVIMPNGVDPHDYRPSARDVETISSADFVVVNGLGLEESLLDAIEQAEAAGVPVFEATDAITVRSFGEGTTGHGDHKHDDGHDHDEGHEHAEEPATAEGGSPDEAESHDGADAHGHGAGDPHFWVDPVAMNDVVRALTVELTAELGLDLAATSAALQAELTELDARTRETLSVIPPERRLLVTGHESMGYFADRYDFELVGALIPATTSQAAPSAAELADLRQQIQTLGVPVIFNELGTPPALSRAISEETGVRVIELGTHSLPEDGSYVTFIDEIAGRIAEGLGQP